MTWKTIKEFSDYKVCDAGEVRSFKRREMIVLKPGIGSQGYPCVILYRNGERNIRKVHRLVLYAFVGKCPDGMEVNHIDGNKQNNRLSNLEYVTKSQNVIHAYQNGLQVPTHERAVEQFMKDEQFIAEYRSQCEASRQTGVNNRDISACCTGRRKTAGGCIWRFADAS